MSLTFDLSLISSRSVGATAEESNSARTYQVGQGNSLGFHSTHRETGHSTMRLIRECAEVGIDIRNQFVDENRLKWFDLEISHTADLNFVGHTIGHHDDEGFDLAFGDQVVHDQIGVTLVAPGGFILAPAMLQVQNRIAFRFDPCRNWEGCRQTPGVRCLCSWRGKESAALYHGEHPSAHRSPDHERVFRCRFPNE